MNEFSEDKKQNSKDKKTFKEIFDGLLNKKISDEIHSGLSGYLKRDQKELSAYEAMAMVQLTKALNGDTKAFELIRDTIGQKNTEAKDSPFSGVVKVLITDE